MGPSMWLQILLLHWPQRDLNVTPSHHHQHHHSCPLELGPNPLNVTPSNHHQHRHSCPLELGPNPLNVTPSNHHQHPGGRRLATSSAEGTEPEERAQKGRNVLRVLTEPVHGHGLPPFPAAPVSRTGAVQARGY